MQRRLRPMKNNRTIAPLHLVPLLTKGSGEHGITHIRFQSEQAGTVEADDSTQWSTSMASDLEVSLAALSGATCYFPSLVTSYSIWNGLRGLSVAR